MKDHEIAQLVNELRDTAIKYRDAQQLRERIAALVVPALRGLRSQVSVRESRSLSRWVNPPSEDFNPLDHEQTR